MSRVQRSGTRVRQQEVLRLVRAGTGRVEDIGRVLAVSPSTVRRDLARLADDGLLARTYGGAQSGPRFTELALADRLSIAAEAKAAIGGVAVQLVPDAGTVFVDAGSTCAHLAQHLRERDDLTIVTRGLEIAAMLVSPSGPTVVLLGGEIAPLSHGMVGPLTQEGLSRHRFDIAFLGCDAVDAQDGVGEPTAAEAATKERAARRARSTVVLADRGKLAPSVVPAWAPLPRGWTLVTDAEQNTTADYSAAGITVLRAHGDDLTHATASPPRAPQSLLGR